MFHYPLETLPGRSLYEKLTDCIRHDIRTGALPAGTHLPSKRRAAADLGVSVVTVKSAYEQLVAEGYITSEERRGYYVAQLDPPLQGFATDASPRAAVPHRAEEPLEDNFTIDLLRSTLSPDLFPLSVWSRLSNRVYRDEGARLLHRVPYNGLACLREAIAAILYETRGIRTTPDCIVVSAGNESLYASLLCFLGRDRVWGVEDPGHRLISRLYATHGAEVRHLPLDTAGVRPDALEASDADILHISPAHHFPTGVVTPITRRQELLAWAAKGGHDGRPRYIIEDDYDSEFRLSGRPIPSLQQLDRTGCVIYINTFSKTIAPALRIAYAVLPPDLAAAYRERLGFLACPVTAAEQLILSAFIREGYFERHLSRMRTRYRALRDRLLAAIAASPRALRYRVAEADGGLHFLLHIDIPSTDAPLSDQALTAAAEAAGLRVLPLSAYAVHAPTPPHTLVISYAALPEDHIEELVRRLDTVG